MQNATILGEIIMGDAMKNGKVGRSVISITVRIFNSTLYKVKAHFSSNYIHLALMQNLCAFSKSSYFLKFKYFCKSLSFSLDFFLFNE